jgi:hypothetical protein
VGQAKLFDPRSSKLNDENGQIEVIPIRSQLFNSAASRGRSATFWADLQQTYFAEIDPKLAVNHLIQIRRDLDQSSI